MIEIPNYARRRSVGVRVGPITIGGDHPVVVQSMTNTDTADTEDSFPKTSIQLLSQRLQN